MLVSQPQIRANFQAISKVFGQNHEPLNAKYQGYHDVLTFRQQGGDPTTSASQVALYTKAVSGNPALFFRPNSSQTPIQLTYPSLSTQTNTNPPTYPATQYTFIAGPFLVYFGYVAGATVGQPITVTPSSTLLYVGCVIKIATANDPKNQYTACATNVSGASFNIQYQTSLSPQKVFYFAIGKP